MVELLPQVNHTIST